MIKKLFKAIHILKTEGLFELINRVRLKWFSYRYWEPISNDLENMENLINRQREKGYDLYDGIDKKDREQLIKLKNDIVIYLVKRNDLIGYRVRKEDAQEKWESYCNRLAIKSDLFEAKSVLEVGSGHSCALFDCGANEIVNVDPLMDVYSQYVNGFHDLFPNIKFINSNAESIPIEDSRFDIVVCVNALDHFNDALESIWEMERLLKYDGLLLLNVDCKDRSSVRPIKRVGHPYSFTHAKLLWLLSQTNLKLIFEKDIPELSSVTMHFTKNS